MKSNKNKSNKNKSIKKVFCLFSFLIAIIFRCICWVMLIFIWGWFSYFDFYLGLVGLVGLVGLF